MDQHILEAAGIVLALAVSKVWDHRKGSKRDKDNGNSISRGFDGLSRKIDQRTDELQAAMDVRFLETNANVARVESFCIGPDGQNGFRKDIGEIRDAVKGLEERERERLTEDRLHGIDRRHT